MKSDQLLKQVRESNNFKLTRDTFKRMTGLNLWLDSTDADDPHADTKIASEYYATLIQDDTLRERCENSHQTMRDEVHGKNVKFSNGISGLTHILVPINHKDQTIGFLRCGGMRDTYRGVLKFMNFSEDLREEGYDDDTLKALEKSFKKLPNLHGEHLTEAIEWLTERASEIETSMDTVEKMLEN